MPFQFELLVLFDVEEPEWAVLSEDVVADCKEIFTLFDTDNVNLDLDLLRCKVKTEILSPKNSTHTH